MGTYILTHMLIVCVDTFMFTHNLTVIFTYAKDVYSLLFKFFIVEVGSNVTG